MTLQCSQLSSSDTLPMAPTPIEQEFYLSSLGQLSEKHTLHKEESVLENKQVFTGLFIHITSYAL